ncbi:RloB family protein [Glycomyces niveus]|uniref:RloB domain-containing protein n=1 Tax=Glycomyces niveus TaxID=2820287 RepID=A0ABS3U649_9ACTN|nr:RloB family protein [Glycomyces sp. NEAU-S30]MBO3734228.1 RloB domain-containing protein [Glycomyces sp. NEAU-S30]
MPRNRTRPDHWRQRERRDKILVVIDAEETERQYLEQFKGKSSPTIPHVKIVTKNKDPLTVVNHAIRLFDSGDFDEAWCVFDEDDYKDGGTFQKAIATAGKRLRLAVSCPCFELWLLLHFEECGSELNQKEARRRLRKHLPDYDKSALRCEDFQPHQADAIRRARTLDAGHKTNHQNPSTGVWRLVERLSGTGSQY